MRVNRSYIKSTNGTSPILVQSPPNSLGQADRWKRKPDFLSLHAWTKRSWQSGAPGWGSWYTSRTCPVCGTCRRLPCVWRICLTAFQNNRNAHHTPSYSDMICIAGILKVVTYMKQWLTSVTHLSCGHTSKLFIQTRSTECASEDHCCPKRPPFPSWEQMPSTKLLLFLHCRCIQPPMKQTKLTGKSTCCSYIYNIWRQKEKTKQNKRHHYSCSL